MSLSSTTSRAQYTGAASTTYAYPFKVFAATDLRVTKRNAAGVETTLAYPADYTVSGVGDAAGGTVTLAVATLTTDTLTIRRVLPLTQPNSFRNQGQFLPATHEDAFDQGRMIDQQLADALDRTLHFGETVDPATVDLTLPAPVADALLAFNSAGTGLTTVAGGFTNALSGLVTIDVSVFPGATAAQKAITALKFVPKVGAEQRLAYPVRLDFTRLDGTSPLVLDYNIKAGDGTSGAGVSDYNTTPIELDFGGHEVRYEIGQYFTSGWTVRMAEGRHVLKDRNGTRVTGSSLWRTVDKNVLVTATAASAVLTVNAGQTYQGEGIVVGSAVSIFGLGARDGGDKATLSGAHNAAITTLTFASVTQLGTTGTILLGSELITYTGKAGNTLTGCTRGAYGTTAGTYVGGEVAQRGVYDVFEVLSRSGTGVGATITLDRAVGLTGTAIKATYGATRWAFEGTGLFDANKDPAVDDAANPHCVLARFVSHGYTSPGLVFANADHGGVGLTQALHCTIHGTGVDIGRPASDLGADVWFFGGVRNCSGVWRSKRGNVALFIDSRSVGGADTDQMSDSNHVVLPWIDGTKRPVAIADGSYNVVEIGTVTNYTSQAVTIEALQWGTAALPKKNRVVLRSADLTGSSELVTTNATNGGNALECMVSGARAGSVEAGNFATVFRGPIVNQALAGGGTATINRALGDHFLVSFTGATGTIGAPSNLPPGEMFRVALTNSSGGAITVTWNAAYKVTSAVPASTKTRVYTFRSDGTNAWLVADSGDLT